MIRVSIINSTKKSDIAGRLNLVSPNTIYLLMILWRLYYFLGRIVHNFCCVILASAAKFDDVEDYCNVN